MNDTEKQLKELTERVSSLEAQLKTAAEERDYLNDNMFKLFEFYKGNSLICENMVGRINRLELVEKDKLEKLKEHLEQEKLKFLKEKEYLKGKGEKPDED